MRLFARKGVASTTVGEIEAAAGLSPRSGALYKYFDSKDALLGAGLERHLATVRDLEQDLALRPLGDLRSEFTLLGHWLLRELEVERDITHILEREGDLLGEVPHAREVPAGGVRAPGGLLGLEHPQRPGVDVLGLGGAARVLGLELLQHAGRGVDGGGLGGQREGEQPHAGIIAQGSASSVATQASPPM